METYTYTVVRQSGADYQIVERQCDFWRVLDAYTHQSSLLTPNGVANALNRLIKFARSLDGACLSPDFRIFASPRRARLYIARKAGETFVEPEAYADALLPPRPTFPWEERGETKQKWLARTRPFLSPEDRAADDAALAIDPLYFEHYFDPHYDLRPLQRRAPHTDTRL